MFYHDQMFYFRCDEALPTKEDCIGNTEEVLAYDYMANKWEAVPYHVLGITARHSHWMQFPRKPLEKWRF